ncbi:hypothetical protein C8J57DRAFT_1265847 [Mycena rebaudengoi]|nr:hypothetical protein C8J57DRAFT_1265847 [Mycena rebaudengoi]
MSRPLSPRYRRLLSTAVWLALFLHSAHPHEARGPHEGGAQISGPSGGVPLLVATCLAHPATDEAPVHKRGARSRK